jgi:hypothetical protein
LLADTIPDMNATVTPVAAEVYKQFHNKQLYMNPLLNVMQIIQMSDTD